MAPKIRKHLSFEPKYHRRVAQGKYVLIPNGSKSVDSAVLAEKDQIVNEGFAIVEQDMERPFNKLEQVDRGNVASVIANTNPDFRSHSE